MPPAWYLALPRNVRDLIEVPISDQTLFQFQIACAALAIVLSVLFLAWLGSFMLQTYRERASQAPEGDPWNQDRLAWRRVLIVLPILPLTRFTEVFIDDVVNFTGLPLAVITYALYVIWHLTAGVFMFFVFEAVGWRRTPLQLQRVSNLVMPLCRAIGGLVAVVLVYRLLLLLGLPSSTVLAFSAVPGLAIGLGASKLLGNLFAGLSIQTDRPLRVGEFCRVGDNLGFVTRIGLRSLELETLESRVTIPNSVVDEATIINFSRRGLPGNSSPMQGLELRLDLEGDWSPFQLEEVVERAQLSEIPIGIAYGTAADQLARVPELMRAAVEQDPQLRCGACRLERIAAFNYDHVLEFSSSHTNHDAFEDSLHDLNRRVISTLEAEGIEIPFPTQTLMLHNN